MHYLNVMIVALLSVAHLSSATGLLKLARDAEVGFDKLFKRNEVSTVTVTVTTTPETCLAHPTPFTVQPTPIPVSTTTKVETQANQTVTQTVPTSMSANPSNAYPGFPVGPVPGGPGPQTSVAAPFATNSTVVQSGIATIGASGLSTGAAVTTSMLSSLEASTSSIEASQSSVSSTARTKTTSTSSPSSDGSKHMCSAGLLAALTITVLGSFMLF